MKTLASTSTLIPWTIFCNRGRNRTQLKNLGFLQESNTGFGIVSDGFEVRRYDYALTSDGKVLVDRLQKHREYKSINDAIRRMLAAGDPNYMELSIAAKAYFLLKKKEGRDVGRRIEQAGRKVQLENLSPESVQRGIAFLKSIGLAN